MSSLFGQLRSTRCQDMAVNRHANVTAVITDNVEYTVNQRCEEFHLESRWWVNVYHTHPCMVLDTCFQLLTVRLHGYTHHVCFISA